jgi:predicted dehydrogenase
MNIKIGIIGYGKMGKIRHDAINKVGMGQVIAISDPEKPEIGIKNFSHAEIINNPDIDAVFICTPNYLNKQLTIDCLKSGKHVFCEKPPSFTANEMEEILNAEGASNGMKLMYGFNHRHHDSVIRMKDLVDSGEYGKILWMRGRYGKSVTEDYFNNWRAKKEMAGGGILLDQGIHMLDLFMYLGGDFDRVKAELSNTFWKLEVEDNAFVILRNTKTGMDASLHSTMTQWRHLFSLEVFL